MTSYSYDSNGNLIAIQNGRGHTVSLGYNAQNQFTSRTEPLGQKTIYKYDAAGNLTEEIKPDGITNITTTFNSNNIPEMVRINGYLKWLYTYDSNGNMSTITNGETGAISSMDYDVNNRIKTLTTGNQKLEYNYTATDAISSIIGSSGHSVFTQKFTYDANNQLINTYRNGSIQSGFDYKPTGALSEQRHVNGIHSFFNYDAGQQLETLKVVKGTAVLLDETNSYDLNGNLIAVTSEKNRKTFDYDVLNQLESQVLPEQKFSESYFYDATGNRLNKTTDENGVTKSTSYTYNANNQLIEANGKVYSYDANGSRIKDERYVYNYNKFNQMTSVRTLSGALIATYTYDEEGRRTSKTVEGKTTNFHYGQGIQVLFETNNDGVITSEFLYDTNGLPLMMTKDGNNYYYIYNSLGEIVSLTDSSGKVVASYSYDAWGNILAQNGTMAAENPLLYKGYRYDSETGLYYLIARYYQAAHGVFLGTDPIGGETADSQSQNGFNYVSNNPIILSDPDGNVQKFHIQGSGGGGGGSILSKTPKSGTYKGTITAVPKKAKTVANHVKKHNGSPPSNYVGGKTFHNTGRSGQKLPTDTTYKEYDVNPKVKGKNRGAERIVIGKNGKIYYTNNHYRTFVRVY